MLSRCVRAVGAAAGVALLLLSVLVPPQRSAAHSGVGEPGEAFDVDWGLAPSWPFRGVVAHYGDESQYRAELEYRYTNELGLQFLDTESNQVTYVRLDHYLDSDALICAWTQSSYSADGFTWVWRDLSISRGRRSWYVPWGEFAYPLFSDDVADVPESEADTVYDPDHSSYVIPIGTDGRLLNGWLIVLSEPACGSDIVMATHALTGEVVACSWSRSGARLVDPAMTDAAASSGSAIVSHDTPSYDTCGLMDLRQWQQMLDELDGL